ncbi:hypothetical protein POSPLADRAFT_1159993 [Postia placenta MAD-698-R-SB12]|uniref:Uncharacterized protein n=1 Tax=Postia placenta MAD-698-R-SB12 TaxID=670580 RepID=A0A1X6MJX0_9APHY|nr:hypothetical protein POSPLADRAFT_1159993 [Postia placenta MAD-698-R-SB12]OSX56546.1 hypothetical protein POSPLADRAFT_1159993 [Postia placenta MAD-698-R-SB12]
MSTRTVADQDLSLPLSTLLRSGTAALHEQVEKSQGAGRLARGELDEPEYVHFLMMLWHVYDTLERALGKHVSHPVLSSIHNPTLLSRAASLSADIAFYLQTNESDWASHPTHVAFVESPPAALTDYVSRMETVADSSDPSPLLAHAYVRYLGDLSGGQIIRNRIIKAYGLEGDAGVAFYDFSPLGGTGRATIGDLKKIKEWFRHNMDTSVGSNEAVKAAILREACIAFELNGGLFAALDDLAPTDSLDVSLPPLGEPSTPVESDYNDQAEAKVVYDSSTPQGTTFQISSVIAVIAAMSLAHFILVVGGFTGDRGAAKLQAVRDWLAAR